MKAQTPIPPGAVRATPLRDPDLAGEWGNATKLHRLPCAPGHQTRGDSLFKAELVRNRGPWKSITDLEIAAVEYIDWFNLRRLHGENGLVPPVEYE